MMFEYKTIPYTIDPGSRIEKIIREYNHLNMSQEVVSLMMEEFNRINEDVLPPKLGEEVKIPVLLPFLSKHETEQPRGKTVGDAKRKP